ncbi:hypothetical protein GP486_000980 [Trichoglossum hirsutum]|uniref:t-SNARE coiled-coil homology domain-containing protein n=1 Tax=Trichoglossum hirsutum TaxID=265104 RepID=A0A9P8RTG6_9PEZI|nr:hypothetical protein GP486_000980 [Trichoglossum hirsutum]
MPFGPRPQTQGKVLPSLLNEEHRWLGQRHLLRNGGACRGQYSEAVLSELESQNDVQLEGMSAKVKMLKDITIAIGDEIRESSALAEKMVTGNDEPNAPDGGADGRRMESVAGFLLGGGTAFLDETD